MSVNIVDKTTGDLRQVAGLGGRSELVPSVSLYQQGTVTIQATKNAVSTTNVALSTPMPDVNYIVNLELASAPALPYIGGIGIYAVSNNEKSVNGFEIAVYNNTDTDTEVIVQWQVFKLMTDESRALDEQAIAQNTANFAPAFSDVTSYAVGDYVTYNNILYRCTTAHTAGVWVAGHFTQVTVDSELSAISYLSRDNLMYHQESGAAVLYNAAYYWQLPSNNTYLVHLTASDKNSPGDNYDGIIKFTYGGTSTTITNITHYRLSGTGSIDAENNSGTLQFSFTSGTPEVCLALLG